jgi:16S rRNA (adenine1518-N6/adenine1519-N6)-dimethyltransferase
VQKEVADRLCAPPGTRSYGALTVFLTAVYDVQTLRVLPPAAFHPRPRVRSAVVRLLPLERPRARETESFRAVVRAAFQSRRKTLRNALLKTPGVDPQRVDAALAAASLDGRCRGETLSVEQFALLAAHLEDARTARH